MKGKPGHKLAKPFGAKNKSDDGGKQTPPTRMKTNRKNQEGTVRKGGHGEGLTRKISKKK